MISCKNCKHFGINSDKNNISWCWAGDRKCSKEESACIIFEANKEEI
ncbi:MAG: hypothetical protein ACQEQF_00275 [Bacillota bacterium]